MAEGVGFEPTVELPLLLISSQVPLTTQPPFQQTNLIRVDDLLLRLFGCLELAMVSPFQTAYAFYRRLSRTKNGNHGSERNLSLSTFLEKRLIPNQPLVRAYVNSGTCFGKVKIKRLKPPQLWHWRKIPAIYWQASMRRTGTLRFWFVCDWQSPAGPFHD